MSRLGILLCLLACVTLRVTCDEVTSQEPSDGLAAEDSLAEVSTARSTLRMTRPLRNTTRDAGGSLKLRCEAEGEPGVTEFTWYKHNAPVITERRRIRIKTNTEERPAWSMLKISILETLDTGFYTCEASNGVDRVKSDAIVRVNLGTFGTLPKSFPPVEPNFPDGPTNIEFEGISPEMEQEAMKGMKKTKSTNQLTDTMIKKLEKNNPSLVPNEQSGYCQQYHGTVCSEYIGSNYIYISEGLSHEYIERKLQGVFTAIAASQQMSPECAEFALPSICLSTFPICDQKTQKPRKICRDECEILAHDKCKSEHALARQHPLLAQQIVLPDCEELPPIGTRESEDCVELGIPLVDELILGHTCYTGDGAKYRGTASTTRSGHTCVPWAHQKEIQTVKHLELIGGHNYCRNPAGDYQDSRPWCYTNDDHITREVCAIRQCPRFNMWLYIAVPAVSAVAIIGLSIGKYCVLSANFYLPLLPGLCCMRRKPPPGKPMIAPSGTAGRVYQGSSGGQGGMASNTGTLEMNPLLTSRQQQQKMKTRAMEIPLGSLRFIQELGEGAFGKVYKGELSAGGRGNNSLVAIKTLKPGANQKTRSDFVRESELMADMRHPNIVCLIGVCMQVTRINYFIIYCHSRCLMPGGAPVHGV